MGPSNVAVVICEGQDTIEKRDLLTRYGNPDGADHGQALNEVVTHSPL